MLKREFLPIDIQYRGMISMVRYVAFLRGINVGGNAIAKMEELKSVFSSLGLQNVKTILNSGNVIFETSDENIHELAIKIMKGLREKFRFEIDVIVRTWSQIVSMVNLNPFKDIAITPYTRFFVTFLPEEPKVGNKVPLSFNNCNYQVLQIKDGSVFSKIELSQNSGTVELMKILENEFGKKITTRNWNTITKITKA